MLRALGGAALIKENQQKVINLQILSQLSKQTPVLHIILRVSIPLQIISFITELSWNTLRLKSPVNI
ncbi:MAG: hypothetical protein EZS28_026704 [Streblomastix strix]|uniref:Uncharacterized protein n=1 Tax=Streblomastix strix TaxID=222440 RepID=A0A5J4V4S9_9EUKA|nr:MAG: hypothetical protein EZS28_026704 [Streblomastix strix]